MMPSGAEVGFLAKYSVTIISIVGAMITGKWFWSWKNSKDNDISDIKKNLVKVTEVQVKHANTFLTAAQVKDEIDKNNKHTMESIANIEKISKSTQDAVIELTMQLREKTAVDKALEEYKKTSKE